VLPVIPGIARAAAPLVVGIAATDVVAPAYYAQHLGYFRSAGLDVDVQVTQNGDAASKFVGVMRRVNAWSNERENERQRRELLRELTKLPASLTDKMVLSPMGTTLEPALAQPVLDVMFKYGFLEQALNPSEIIWRG
jgi:ABC-type nitrate/sulfonate/bicarbonate transport system substrate-binding protein